MPQLPTLILGLLLQTSIAYAQADTPGDMPDPMLQQILQRLEALEAQNAQLQRQVDALLQQNAALREQPARVADAGAAAPSTPSAQPPAPSPDEWASRIRFKGDLRFRRESTDNEIALEERTREGVRARFGAQIKVNDKVEGEVALGTGGGNPRGGSATLGGGTSRKDFDLDLAYMSWRALDDLTVTAGKMRQPFFRPGFSGFIDNEIRPEGVALAYEGPHGLFGSAFRYWLEERAQAPDSMLTGAQAGWRAPAGDLKLVLGLGYYDYGSVRGQPSRFGNGVMNELGNTVIGTGADARYVYDYDIAQAFTEAGFAVGSVPLTIFADYARNIAADDGLDAAYNVGVAVGKANAVGRWELGVMTQRVEKDALFAQWIDSDFGGGLADNRGEAYRFGWMLLKNLLLNVTYYDTQYDVEAEPLHYRHWQLDFNFTF
ncbi:MAG: putative porin [Steroidobacteraceae bacterium]